MIPSDPKKRFWFILGVIAVLALIFFADALHDRSRSGQKLRHFDGVLAPGHETYDTAKSALYVRAGEALKAGDASGAETIYREIAARYPKDSDGFSALGACLYFEKKYDESKTEYLHAVELNPQSGKAFYGLGCVAFDQREFEEAKTNLEKALSYDEHDALSHRLLGFVYEHTGDAPKALTHFERAIALDPSMASDPDIKRRLQWLKGAASFPVPPATSTN